MTPRPLEEFDAVITPCGRHAVIVGPAHVSVAGRERGAFVNIRYIDDRVMYWDERTTTIRRSLLRLIEPDRPLPPPVRIERHA